MNESDAIKQPAIPSTFFEYLRSIGPGLVMALTWLGAGDLVDAAVAGGNYGYALMWAMALALFMRFAFVTIIAKYQLCNQHGESVMGGLKRVHPYFPILIGAIGIFFGHFYGSFLIKGLGESTNRLLGVGPAWSWSIFWCVIASGLVLRGLMGPIEKVFYVFLAFLSVSLIGVAAWGGPAPLEIAKGILFFDVPEKMGPFGPVLVITSLIGAVGGSIANLLYPYFIQQKGWKGPAYRRVQMYDLAFGTIVITLLNLSVWTIGAEILNPRGISVESLDDLANLLTITIGKLGGPIFYLGVYAALYSSVIGNAMGYGLMLSDIRSLYRPKEDRGRADATSKTLTFKIVVLWCLFSPLIWSIPSMPSFISLTLVANAAAVIVLPLLSGSLWLITARSQYIGKEYRNGILENVIMATLFVLAVWGAYKSVIAILDMSY
jgi:Mn2+/Fe2+ NRAMP family transporter